MFVRLQSRHTLTIFYKKLSVQKVACLARDYFFCGLFLTIGKHMYCSTTAHYVLLNVDKGVLYVSYGTRPQPESP